MVSKLYFAFLLIQIPLDLVVISDYSVNWKNKKYIDDWVLPQSYKNKISRVGALESILSKLFLDGSDETQVWGPLSSTCKLSYLFRSPPLFPKQTSENSRARLKLN